MAKKRAPGKMSAAFRLAGHWLVYAAFRCIEAVLKVLPIEAVWRLGRIMGGGAYVVGGKYRRLALHNLRIAFGREKDDAERQRIAREHFRSLFANILCGFKFPMMTQEELVKRVTVEGQAHIRNVATDKGILCLVSHSSCWELLTQVPSLFIFNRQPATVYQPLRNPFLNALVVRRRRKLNYTLFDRQEGFTGPMKLLSEGGCLGILVDQHSGDHGIWCPFFDRLASTTPITSLLAHRSRALLMPLAIYDDGPGRWRMVFSPAVDPRQSKRSVEELTTWTNQALEQMIRRAPENWFWVHNRWKTPKPQFLLRHYKRGIALPQDYDFRNLQPFELLVRSPNWLGDACMAFPAIRALKAGRPDLKLTVFGPEKLRDLWESQPEVDRYIGKAGKEGLLAVARRIKNSGIHFDAAILLTNSTRSTLEFWLVGIPRLVGYRGSLRSKLLNQIIREPQVQGPPLHHARRYLHIARSCGAEIDAPEIWQPDGEAVLGRAACPKPPPDSVPQDEGASGRSALPARRRIGICAGAEYGPAKRWPLDRFADVIRQVSLARPGVDWVFYGAPGETRMGEELSHQIDGLPHTNLVGKTSLKELIAHLRGCDLLVTNDTGTMHLAAALGVATVSIFGSTEPVLTGPLGDQHTVIRHHVPCSPCFRRECPFGHYDCMMKVAPERVAEAVLNSLTAKTSGSATSE